MLRTQVLKATQRMGKTHCAARSINTSAVVNNLVSRTSLYWTKVAGELVKHVYIKEAMSPPTLAEFRTVYRQLYQSARSFISNPCGATQVWKSLSQADVVRYSAYGIQFLGLFTIGEMVGRRSISGYKH